MRLMGLIPFGKAFVKEQSSLSTENAMKVYYDRVWEEVAIRHNSLKAAAKHIMGPLSPEQFQDLVNDINYRIEQTKMAVDR